MDKRTAAWGGAALALALSTVPLAALSARLGRAAARHASAGAPASVENVPPPVPVDLRDAPAALPGTSHMAHHWTTEAASQPSTSLQGPQAPAEAAPADLSGSPVPPATPLPTVPPVGPTKLAR